MTVTILFLLPLQTAHGRKDGKALESTCSYIVHSPILKSSPACIVCRVHHTNNLPSYLPCPPLVSSLCLGSYPYNFREILSVPLGIEARYSGTNAENGLQIGRSVSLLNCYVAIFSHQGEFPSSLSEEPVKLGQYQTPSKCPLRVSDFSPVAPDCMFF